MKVRIDDSDLCRYWVSSESDGDKEYIVDLCEYPRGVDVEGNLVLNGACGLTNERIHGCRDFSFRCERELKNPANAGKIFRCKHIRCAREYALTILLPHLSKMRPNTHEDSQP